MDDFDAHLEDMQSRWRGMHVKDARIGEQNRVSRPWILHHDAWTEGLWKGIRESVSEYLEREDVQRHLGSHNLKSSWMLCANLYFPFREDPGRQLVAAFLRSRVSKEIEAVERIELEYAEPAPLDPQTLLGEPETGKRGANQTSPDVAFLVRLGNGKSGLILTESKLAEHSFYACSGRKKSVENPDRSRCMDWPRIQADPIGQCWQMNWEQEGRPNRKYWEHVQFSEEGKASLRRCPAATAGYQLFRQQALAEAIAASGQYDLVASCVAYDARNDDLIHSLRSTGVDDFATGWGRLFGGKAKFATWTHQEWVAWVRTHDSSGVWGDWLEYVEARYGYGKAAL
ncbi:MAG TPA: hypothetical protein VGI92_12115 [Gemmatimonadales bacterium]|jgi:hypothetical protein